MPDHTDAPDSKSHPRVDNTDLFVFQKPRDSTKSIFVLNVNPEDPRGAEAEGR